MTAPTAAPTTTLAKGLPLLGGLPFLDDAFLPTRLTAAAAAVRHTHAIRLGLERPTDLRHWLDPERACQARPHAQEVPSSPVSQDEQDRIFSILEHLTVLVPPWEPLLRLPVRYLRLKDSPQTLSASSFSWPQHVYLGQDSLTSFTELREHIVHELCHQWLYLIEELWDLDTPDAPGFTLPSGTTHRSPREVIGAAHVAAALVRMYRATGEEAHVGPLTTYGRGCLHILATGAAGHVTCVGSQIVSRLKEAL